MIIFDLDGTLADCEHRRHFVVKPKKPECSCDPNGYYYDSLKKYSRRKKMSECAFCKDKNFRRMNPYISDWCLLLKSEHLSPMHGISIDVNIQPPIEEELRFCGLGCLKKWLEKEDVR